MQMNAAAFEDDNEETESTTPHKVGNDYNGSGSGDSKTAPSDWTKHEHEVSGESFIYNHKTGETIWERRKTQ
jgi:hypothetical protein